MLEYAIANEPYLNVYKFGFPFVYGYVTGRWMAISWEISSTIVNDVICTFTNMV